MPKRTRKLKPAPDWFGCGRTHTQESWDRFWKAYREYYEARDRAAGTAAQPTPMLGDTPATTNND